MDDLGALQKWLADTQRYLRDHDAGWINASGNPSPFEHSSGSPVGPDGNPASNEDPYGLSDPRVSLMELTAKRESP